nr:hypothetical protein [Morganella morganii]
MAKKWRLAAYNPDVLFSSQRFDPEGSETLEKGSRRNRAGATPLVIGG